MKKILIITIFAFVTSTCLEAQVQISTTYGKSDIGWNFRFGLEYFPIKHISFGFGSRIIHTHKYVYNSYIYKNNFYPVSTIENFGIYATFNYYPLKNSTYLIQPFISYDFAFSRAHLRLRSYFEQYNEATGEPTGLYEKRIVLFNQLNAFEHYISTGIDIMLFKGVKLTQKIGVGVTHFSGFDYNQPNALGIASIDDTYEFSWLFFNIGFKYDFGNVIKKKKHLTNAKKQ